MTPFQDEIARIIRGFSDSERELFEAMGGSAPALSAPEPLWWCPGDKLHTFAKVHHHRDLIRVKLEGRGGGVHSMREAALVLGVSEDVVRNRLRVGHGRAVIRGTVVTRTAA